MSRRTGPRAALRLAAGALLLALVAFQAWAYCARLPLSLGPRVVLQPWLLRQGFVQYEQIADPHTPLMPLALAALVPAFSDGLTLPRVALVALLSLSTLLAAWVAWRRAGWLGGLGAAGFVVLWSRAFGFGKLWHESFLAPLYLLLFLLCEPTPGPRRAGRWLLLGCLGGVAVLVKQHAALVVAAAVLWSAFAGWGAHRSWGRLVHQIGLAGLAALGIVAAYAVAQAAWASSLDGFLYWTTGYPLGSDYSSLAALAPSWPQLAGLAPAGLLLPAALLCLVDAWRRRHPAWRSLGLGLAMLAASTATAYPRFALFHLQPSLPLLAVVNVLALAHLLSRRRTARALPAGLCVAAAACWLVSRAPDYAPSFLPSPQHVDEYSDLVPLARQVRAAVGPGDCLYVYPDDEELSNLYYLLGCAPPRFWIFHYPWYGSERLQALALAALEAQPPAWVAYFPGRWEVDTAPALTAYVDEHYLPQVRLTWAEGEVLLLKRK